MTDTIERAPAEAIVAESAGTTNITEADVWVDKEDVVRDDQSIAERLFEHPKLRPETDVKIGERHYFVSQRIGETFSEREYAVLWFEDPEGSLIPRMLYKSQSDGGWRLSTAIEKSGRFVKGAERHYTQENKLHPDILDALDSLKPPVGSDYETGRALIAEFRDDGTYQRVRDFMDEVRFFSLPDDLQKFGILKAGYLDADNVKRAARELGLGSIENSHDAWGLVVNKFNELMADFDGFLPDFEAGPNSSVKREHTLLGPVEFHSYQTEVFGQPIQWEIGDDGDGHVWIDRIRLADNPVSTYGTDTRVLDSGFLTSKPLEYSNQASALPGVQQFEMSNYVDISPYLRQLEPIKRYLAAKK